MLVSSEGRADEATARRLVGYYERRWGREEFFRLLKTDLRVEDRRLRGQERAADAATLCEYVGRLAGFLPSRRQPLPGLTKLWQGLTKLRQFTQGWQAGAAARPVDSPPPRTESGPLGTGNKPKSL